VSVKARGCGVGALTRAWAVAALALAWAVAALALLVGFTVPAQARSAAACPPLPTVDSSPPRDRG